MDRMSPSLIPSVIPMTTAVTRMHSSRMRTDRLLTASQHALPGGGGTCLRVYLPGGCTCPGGTCQGSTCLGCTCPGGVPARGCTCLGGVVPVGGTCPGGCTYWGECTCPGGGGNNGHGLEQRYVLTDH